MSVIPESDPLPTPETHRWVYEKCRPCINAGPFMIGAPSWGCETHHVSDRSVPCFRELRGCTLPCPYCPQRCQWTQYVPLIDLTECHMRRIVYTGGIKTRSDVKCLAVSTLVGVTRGPGQTDTLRVRLWPADKPSVLAPVALARTMPDITPYLLHLWQLRELTEHFGQRFIRARGFKAKDAPPGRKVPRPNPSPALDLAAELARRMNPE